MNFTTRPATANDLEMVYLLVSELEGRTMDKTSFDSTFQKNLSDPNIHYLIAENDSNVVGFISLHVQHLLHHSKPTCEIQELIVLPESRGFGVGKLLIEAVEKIAHSIQPEEIELTTSIFRVKAQAFYRELGYEQTHNKFVKKL